MILRQFEYEHFNGSQLFIQIPTLPHRTASVTIHPRTVDNLQAAARYCKFSSNDQLAVKMTVWLNVILQHSSLPKAPDYK